MAIWTPTTDQSDNPTADAGVGSMAASPTMTVTKLPASMNALNRPQMGDPAVDYGSEYEVPNVGSRAPSGHELGAERFLVSGLKRIFGARRAQAQAE
jgi:hypothetical protein